MAPLKTPMVGGAAFYVLLFATSFLINDETEALKIIGLKVPGLVQNGTEESVVLDCLYDLGSSDETAGGLVVKWFFDGDPEPVYQWIPRRRPQDFGRLRGRLDLNQRATNDINTMHRALVIRRPTVELSGKYTCLVSTFTEEKSVSETLVVFVPEKALMMSQSKQDRSDSVRVSCKAEGVYPEPNITLSLLRHQPGASLNHLRVEATIEDDDDDDDDGDDIDVDVSMLLPLEGVTVQTRRTDTGVYDAEAWVDVPDRFLAQEGADGEPSPPVSFHCLLSIPNSEYSRKKSLIYYPGSTAAAMSATWLCFFVLFVLTATQRLALSS
ncbi:uncharacterized protein LOC124166674 isoform X2 [Ischnura elegans]|uniref:uncharacterized protein LOC124166674 isoform X2 n=1 Tax=Ischnura elegans TaxID=197161 RepID=UPI001ED86DDA|nr:uncharacterized protein LOC124166674 isoform X2 [Ischnura elegans]